MCSLCIPHVVSESVFDAYALTKEIKRTMLTSTSTNEYVNKMKNKTFHVVNKDNKVS